MYLARFSYRLKMISVSKLLAHSWWKLIVIIITKCIIWKLLKVGKANSVITIVEHPFIICQMAEFKIRGLIPGTPVTIPGVT